MLAIADLDRSAEIDSIRGQRIRRLLGGADEHGELDANGVLLGTWVVFGSLEGPRYRDLRVATRFSMELDVKICNRPCLLRPADVCDLDHQFVDFAATRAQAIDDSI